MTVQAPPPPADAFVSNERPPFTDRLTGSSLLLLAIAALIANIGLQARVANVATSIAILLTILLLVHPLLGHSRAVSQRHSKWLLGGAAILALWLPVRASTWLTHLNGWTALALIAAAVLFDQPHRPRLSVPYLATLTERFSRSRFGFLLLAHSAAPWPGRRRESIASVARGVLFALVPVALLGGILASADAVFASVFSRGMDAEAIVRHGFFSIFMALVLAGVLCIARSPQHPEATETSRPIGATEALVVLTLVAALFAVFALTQLFAALGNVDAILANQGISQSEYAREGFFRLLIVAGLTLPLLTGLRAVTSHTSKSIERVSRFAGALVSALTVVIVAVAIIRLGLYIEAFGQTTLRWYCTGFAWMLGGVFALLAVRHLVASPRAWFGWTTLAIVFVTLVAANVVNPEARVAQRNLTEPAAEASLDADYLTKLSADAWPTLLAHEEQLRDALGGGDASPVFRQRCERAAANAGYGLLGANLGRIQLGC